MFRLALRRRKLVRIHLEKGPSLEGILVGRRGGHYLLERAKLLEQAAATVALEGWVEVPERNVVFVQILATGAG
jgi:hypothetical protein